MQFEVVSINGIVCPASKAVLPVNKLETTYSFGVYEAVKVRNGKVYFLEQHIDRLFHSARCIDLSHTLSKVLISKYIQELSKEVDRKSYNLKMLLYGGLTPDSAQLFIIPSAPYFPDRKWYRDGIILMSETYERWMPQAKTLNMLASYCIYNEAKKKKAYDALLKSRKGNVLEGTRTNVYLMKSKKIFSPPKSQILEGVTMMSLKKVIDQTDFSLTFQEIPFASILEYDSMFLTSTSAKILPVRAVDGNSFPQISTDLRELIKIYDQALERCQGDFSLLK